MYPCSELVVGYLLRPWLVHYEVKVGTYIYVYLNTVTVKHLSTSRIAIHCSSTIIRVQLQLQIESLMANILGSVYYTHACSSYAALETGTHRSIIKPLFKVRNVIFEIRLDRILFVYFLIPSRNSMAHV